MGNQYTSHLTPEMRAEIMTMDGLLPSAVARRFGISTEYVRRLWARRDAVRTLCMDDAEWVQWKAANDSTTFANLRATSPCADCPVAFSNEMKAIGRCNGVPKGDE